MDVCPLAESAVNCLFFLPKWVSFVDNEKEQSGGALH